MIDTLYVIFPWIKSLHVIAVISWMAGIFYLPRLFAYHTERSIPGDVLDQAFQVMEQKLLRIIMNPAMTVTWVAGLIMVFTPGVIDWGSLWPWVKAACVIVMTWFHHWLALRRKDFARGENTRTGRTYRLMNEVPTIMMIVIVVSVIVKY